MFNKNFTIFFIPLLITITMKTLHTVYLFTVLLIVLSGIGSTTAFILPCFRNKTLLTSKPIVSSESTVYLHNTITHYRLHNDESVYYIVNKDDSDTPGVSQLTYLREEASESTVISSTNIHQGKFCGLSRIDSDGVLYTIQYRHHALGLSQLYLTQIHKKFITSTVQYTGTNVPIIDLAGHHIGYMNASDSSTVFTQGSCMLVEVVSKDTAVVVVKSHKGSVVLVFYETRIGHVSRTHSTILLPEVIGTEVDQLSPVGVLRVDPATGNVYAIISITSEVQRAFEKFHNLKHNTTIQIPSNLDPSTPITVLFKVTPAGDIVGIKQLSLYSNIVEYNFVDADVYSSANHSLTLHVIGTEQDKLHYIRFDNVENIQFEPRQDPTIARAYNVSETLETYPTSIAAEDSYNVAVSGYTDKRTFGYSDGFILELNPETIQSSVWGYPFPVITTNVQVINNKIYYIELHGTSNPQSSYIIVEYCGEEPSPNHPHFDARLIGAIIGGILVVALTIVVLLIMIHTLWCKNETNPLEFTENQPLISN
jgi:hypothetical protein